MKIFLLCVLAVAGKVHKHTLIEKPRPIAYHALAVDLDRYRPPARETGLDGLEAAITSLTGKEKARLKKDKENLDKVQTEFFKSDLHKEALNLRMIPENNN